MARVTVEHVAKAAGVSPGTVSKVFNGRADVSASTRSTVWHAAQQLGYRPPRRGAALGACRVAVIVNDLENAYTPAVLDGLVREAQRVGIIVELHEWDGGRTREDGAAPGSSRWLQATRDTGITGVILVTVPVSATQIRLAGEIGVHLVSLDPFDEGDRTPVSVGATNWRGGAQATQHLVGLGHRRIGVLAGPTDSRPAMERLAGFQWAMREAGIEVDPDLVVHGGFRYEDGLAGGRYLLHLTEPPTAVFAACDLVAFGVDEAARRMGLRVPDDVSLIGFDDGYMALWHSPPLTTIRQPLGDLGAEAVRQMRRLLDGEAALPEIELATSLVVRQSTAPLGGRAVSGS